MVIYSGLEQYKNEGYFFKDNKNLCNDCGISEPTLISGLVKLEKLGYIKRKIGSRGKASEYMLTDLVDAQLKVVNATKTETDTLKNEGNFSNNFSKTDQNFSTDTETEKEGPSCISSFLLDPNIKVLLKESINTLSLEIRKELACAYEERISKLEERLNKASKYTKDLEDTLRKVVDQVNSLTKRIQELEDRDTNSVDQDNNTNVGTQEVEQEPKQGLKDISSTCVDQESGVCEANRMSTYDLISTVENSTDQDARKQAAKELQCRVNRHELNGKQFGKAIAVLNQFNGVSSTSISKPSPCSAHPLPTDNRRKGQWNESDLNDYREFRNLHFEIQEGKSVTKIIADRYLSLLSKMEEIYKSGCYEPSEGFHFKLFLDKKNNNVYKSCVNI